MPTGDYGDRSISDFRITNADYKTQTSGKFAAICRGRIALDVLGHDHAGRYWSSPSAIQSVTPSQIYAWEGMRVRIDGRPRCSRSANAVRRKVVCAHR